MPKERKLILEDGSEYRGIGFGGEGEVIGELVFNTSMAGYQEILTDPSYTGQIVILSYPLEGNYGIAREDSEGRKVAVQALVARDIHESPHAFRSVLSLPELLEEQQVPGIYGLDTRSLVRKIRSQGCMRALVTGADTPLAEGLSRLRSVSLPRDAVSRCSCSKKWYSRTSNPHYSVAVLDCGIKESIIRSLNEHRCTVTILPYDTGAEEILSLSPDGVLISNGPGDPRDVLPPIPTLRALRGRVPLFGICLGHQLLALSLGGETYKLPFGHRGGNHPVKDLASGRIFMTSQNHGYAVSEESLKSTGLLVSHRNLLDGTVEELTSPDGMILGVQFHPESAPGPRDGAGLFTEFTRRMSAWKGGK